MTREEREDAIDIIQSILDKYEEDECLVTEITIGDEDIKALKMAIKALDQELVLDKIRAEIMQLDYDIESVDYDYNDVAQTEMIHTICREEVLRIFDKYNSER